MNQSIQYEALEVWGYTADLLAACQDAIGYIEHGGSAYDQTELLEELRTAVASHA